MQSCSSSISLHIVMKLAILQQTLLLWVLFLTGIRETTKKSKVFFFREIRTENDASLGMTILSEIHGKSVFRLDYNGFREKISPVY